MIIIHGHLLEILGDRLFLATFSYMQDRICNNEDPLCSLVLPLENFGCINSILPN